MSKDGNDNNQGTSEAPFFTIQAAANIIVPVKKMEGQYAEIIHCYEKPGDYIVSVESINENGFIAIVHLHVCVEKLNIDDWL